MQPRHDSCCSDHQYQRKHNIAKLSDFLLSRRPRTRIIFVILSVELLLLLYNRSFSRSFTASLSLQNRFCSSGKVYVYDLPPKFNSDLINNCHSLNPWNSLCEALSNGGFGRRDDKGLRGVIPDEFLPSWFLTDQFATEIIFHSRMESHPCRTRDFTAASAFYIPFYAGLAVGRHLWSSPAASSDERDRDCADLLQWLHRQESWKMKKTHFMALGRITWDFRRPADGSWGSIFLRMPAMKHVTRFIVERSPWDEHDVGVPYPTGFHPRSAAEVRAWQRFLLARNRSTLFSFAGSARPGFDGDFRALLLEECARAGEPTCRAARCSSGAQCGGDAVKLFLDSAFCLQPRGDSYTRRSLFDCMLAGTVPVLFWRRSAYEQYRWYLPAGDGGVGGGEEEEWSVFIDNRKVRRGKVSVAEVLAGIGEEKVRKMREKVVEMMPKLLYAGVVDGLGDGMEDAFEVALRGMLRLVGDRRASW